VGDLENKLKVGVGLSAVSFYSPLQSYVDIDVAWTTILSSIFLCFYFNGMCVTLLGDLKLGF
jgi:hypothetical protein